MNGVLGLVCARCAGARVCMGPRTRNPGARLTTWSRVEDLCSEYTAPPSTQDCRHAATLVSNLVCCCVFGQSSARRESRRICMCINYIPTIRAACTDLYLCKIPICLYTYYKNSVYILLLIPRNEVASGDKNARACYSFIIPRSSIC